MTAEGTKYSNHCDFTGKYKQTTYMELTLLTCCSLATSTGCLNLLDSVAYSITKRHSRSPQCSNENVKMKAGLKIFPTMFKGDKKNKNKVNDGKYSVNSPPGTSYTQLTLTSV